MSGSWAQERAKLATLASRSAGSGRSASTQISCRISSLSSSAGCSAVLHHRY